VAQNAENAPNTVAPRAADRRNPGHCTSNPGSDAINRAYGMRPVAAGATCSGKKRGSTNSSTPSSSAASKYEARQLPLHSATTPETVRDRRMPRMIPVCTVPTTRPAPAWLCDATASGTRICGTTEASEIANAVATRKAIPGLHAALTKATQAKASSICSRRLGAA
jgi:hypothetical protein